MNVLKMPCTCTGSLATINLCLYLDYPLRPPLRRSASCPVKHPLLGSPSHCLGGVIPHSVPMHVSAYVLLFSKLRFILFFKILSFLEF